MRLLNIYTLKFQEFFENEIPPYHILSHRWSREEISYEEYCRDPVPDKRGYRKVLDFCAFVRQRRRDGFISRRPVDRRGAHRIIRDDMSDLAAHGFEPEDGERLPLAGGEWVWVDTCCIDKRSSAELTEAINSMFKWYAASYECIVRLTDVPSWQHFGKVSPYHKADTNDRLDDSASMSESDRRVYVEWRRAHVTKADREELTPKMLGALLPYFRRSMWFSRGWTLQELLAPEMVVFCNSAWEIIGHVCKNGNCTRNLYAYGIHLTEVVSEISSIPERYLSGEEPIQGASIAQRMSWASMRTTTRLEDEAYALIGIFNVNMPMVYGEGRKAFRRLQLEIISKSTDQSIFAWNIGEGFVPIFASSPADFSGSGHVVRTRRSTQNPYTITNNGLQLCAKLYLPAVIPQDHEHDSRYSERFRLLRLACRDGNGRRIVIKLAKGEDRYFRSIDSYESGMRVTAPLGRLLGEKVIYVDTGVEDTVVPGWRDNRYSSDSDVEESAVWKT